MSDFGSDKTSFNDILNKNQADKAAQLYYDSCKELLESPDEHFTGALDISRK